MKSGSSNKLSEKRAEETASEAFSRRDVMLPSRMKLVVGVGHAERRSLRRLRNDGRVSLAATTTPCPRSQPPRGVRIDSMVGGSDLTTKTLAPKHGPSLATMTTTQRPASQSPPRGVYLAPMVRGSELAMRMLARKHGASVCYSPMIRAQNVLEAHRHFLDGTPPSGPGREDVYLCLLDTCPEDSGLVVQMCGDQPGQLASATEALLDMFSVDDGGGGIGAARASSLGGIDLNLGCPQKCAKEGGFGAFLAETRPDDAIECVRAMRRAIDGRKAAATPPLPEAPPPPLPVMQDSSEGSSRRNCVLRVSPR